MPHFYNGLYMPCLEKSATMFLPVTLPNAGRFLPHDATVQARSWESQFRPSVRPSVRPSHTRAL